MLSKKAMRNPFIKRPGDSGIPLPDINERFVDACENGDCATVSAILQHIKDFNIEVTDNLGRTALRLAVENEHLEVVQELLAKSDSQKIRDALLLAIFLGHTQIAEAILKHPKYKILNEKKFLDGDADSFWQTPSSDDAQFSPDITPIMLASQYNRTEIVQMLLLNGDRISKPHDFNCKCTECLNKFKFDSLRHAQSRLNAYKGLASESYISLASIDPILTAFELGRELEILAEKEKYFKNEYLQLRHSLSIYSVKLLNNVRGRDELEIVLNKTGKEREDKYERLARLDLALKYQEKPFVAHSNCQQKLVEIWYSGIRKISKMNPIVIFAFIVLHILLLPISSVFYIIAPKSKIGRFMSLPSIKFISHFASYLIFIAILVALNFELAYTNPGEKFSNLYKSMYTCYAEYVEKKFPTVTQFSDFYFRPNAPTSIEIVISIWIIGQTWHEIKKILECGLNDYIYSSTNLVNFCMNMFYLASYGLKYFTMAIVSNEMEVLANKNETFCEQLDDIQANDTVAQMKVYYTFYWLNSDRYYWVAFDPIHLADGFYSLANVLTFARLCFFLPASQQLGPLQITLGKMINDVVKFLCIFSIIFTSFVFGLNSLYWYYDPEIRKNVEFPERSETHTKAEEAFGTLSRALKTLFFALYTIGASTDTLIDPFQNTLTVTIGYMLFGIFHIANITIMINMLIAMMTESYQNIMHHSDIEWKFARSKLYMEYIKEGFTLPVPLNLLPTPVATYNSLKRCITKCKERTNSNDNGKGDSKEPPKSRSKSMYHEDQPSFYEMRSQQSGNHTMTNGNLPSIETGGPRARRSQTNINENNNAETNFINIDNQKLTYRIVMERVVKRFLMHNQGDSDDPKQNDFDELKQDMQVMRYEMLNDLKKSREDNMRNMFIINGGIQFLAEEILTNNINKESLNSAMTRYKDLLNAHNNILKSDSDNVFDQSMTPPPTLGMNQLINDFSTIKGSKRFSLPGVQSQDAQAKEMEAKVPPRTKKNKLL